MKGLKGIISAVAALLAICGCEKYSDGNGRLRGRIGPFLPLAEEEAAEGGDTVVLVSAVEVMDRGYDWCRDSLGVGFEARIVLFENGVRLREIETGEHNSVSPDFDMHHIVGRDIYTEYSDGVSTVFKCNDTVICSFEGRERLMGVLRSGDGFHILSQNRSGSGICLRHGERILFSNPSATLFGSFSDISYPESGALYADKGNSCFAFRCQVAGKESIYVCEGGNARMVVPPSEGKVEDVKVVDGTVRMWISDNPFGRYCSESGCRSFNVKGMRCVNGKILRGCFRADACSELVRTRTGRDGSMVLCCDDGSMESYPCRGAFLAKGDGHPDLVSVSGGAIKVYRNGSELAQIRDSCYFMSRGCACKSGRRTYLALTPCDRLRPPYLWADGDTTQFNIYGFLTGVNVVVSRSNKSPSNHPGGHLSSP